MRILIGFLLTVSFAVFAENTAEQDALLTELIERADRGNADAQFTLGLMYDNGEGVPEDDALAVKWYTKAAEQGYVLAQYNLGLMYANGEGVPEDLTIAYMWENLAAAQGQQDAKKNKEIIAKNMTREQIAEAQKLSSECLAKNYRKCGY